MIYKWHETVQYWLTYTIKGMRRGISAVSRQVMQYSNNLLIQRDPRPHILMLHVLMLCYPVVYKCRLLLIVHVWPRRHARANGLRWWIIGCAPVKCLRGS